MQLAQIADLHNNNNNNRNHGYAFQILNPFDAFFIIFFFSLPRLLFSFSSLSPTRTSSLLLPCRRDLFASIPLPGLRFTSPTSRVNCEKSILHKSPMKNARNATVRILPDLFEFFVCLFILLLLPPFSKSFCFLLSVGEIS